MATPARDVVGASDSDAEEGQRVGRWQRFNPAALRAVRERFGWSPEKLALRLRVWQQIERMNQEIAPGSGLLALRAFVDQDNLDGLSDDQIADVEMFLAKVLSKRGNSKAPRSNVSGVTIRRWESGETLPMVAQLHVILDALNFDAAMLFEPRHPGRPKGEARQTRELEQWLNGFASDFRAANPPRHTRPPGRPRQKPLVGEPSRKS